MNTMNGGRKMTIRKPSEKTKIEAKVDLKDEKEAQKSRIDDETFFWLNKTKSGKGVIIVIDEQAFISSLANVKEFIDETRRGVKFSLLMPEE